MSEDRSPTTELTTEQALKQWRDAERTAAVARRGTIAAKAAAEAAIEAQEAATATALAAKDALASMALAEDSAAKTAKAARMVVDAAGADLADAQSEQALSEVAEASAHNDYNSAIKRAADR